MTKNKIIFFLHWQVIFLALSLSFGHELLAKQGSTRSIDDTMQWHSGCHYRIKATVDSGMYIRNDYQISTIIDFSKLLAPAVSVNANSIYVVDCDSGNKMNSFFDARAKKANVGVISWLMEGEIEPLIEKDYYIYFDIKGKNNLPTTDNAALKTMKTNWNLVDNGGFEEKGQWTTRGQSGDKTFCGFSGNEVHSGKRSFMISNHDQKTKGYKSYSKIFKLKPNTRYSLSGLVKVTDIPPMPVGNALISLVFLDENRQEKRPPKEKNYRKLLAVSVSPDRSDAKDFLGKWVDKKTSCVTPQWVRYGKIAISTYHFTGTVFFDEINVSEIRGEEPEVSLGFLESRMQELTK